ncbi:MAG: FeoB-associated Cys-rich membrane protein [Lachnospiraceae bacterium]|nr:FeoB-associated Cys-rich membrane protein [Lachnospiraceae bacterium]
MINYIIGAVLALLVGAACAYLWKAKKSGRKCVGCPCNGTCCKRKNIGS